MNFLAIVEAFFSKAVSDIWVRLQGIFSSVLEDLSQGEAQDLHDACAQFNADRAAGKDLGAAAADALSVFYNESKGTVGTIAHKYFEIFLLKSGVS